MAVGLLTEEEEDGIDGKSKDVVSKTVLDSFRVVVYARVQFN